MQVYQKMMRWHDFDRPIIHKVKILNEATTKRQCWFSFIGTSGLIFPWDRTRFNEEKGESGHSSIPELPDCISILSKARSCVPMNMYRYGQAEFRSFKKLLIVAITFE